MPSQTFEEISPADFFYRNREIAGFTNPSRAIFAAIRELVENSLDASEQLGEPPDIYVRLTQGEDINESAMYVLRVEDNGSGITSRHIPSAFGQVLFGSKYKLKQSRGTFGLGGTMAVLYGQITTHKPAYIVSSTGSTKVYIYGIMIDIRRNKPIILERKVLFNKEQWHGTIVEFYLEGDYLRAMPKIIEYLKQTALVNPFANITFVDPKGRLYKFTRVTVKMPPPPKETLPHPYGVDVETVKRLVQVTPHRRIVDFLQAHFHRVSERIAQRFLEYAGVPATRHPRKLDPEEIVKLVQMMKRFEEFRPPSASCLSPLGEEMMKVGILKELRPDFVAVCQRKPSTYAGHPFIVETAIAYGGDIPRKGDFMLYRFANRIPLLYDEASDVSFRVIKMMNWRRYKISQDMPIAALVHICSTKIPYKTVGKEFIADRPEVKREVLNGMREAARKLQRFLSKREHVEREKRRLSVFSKYLPKIARFSTELADKEKPPDIQALLNSVSMIKRRDKIR
ncbi:MAG: DNA topoisomerase VI subunit B [Candidatus Bathyarchaeota archaeon]|nr:DNA topoisomerase VI subunit B [Candidatus Bathyarchaeota archaeon]